MSTGFNKVTFMWSSTDTDPTIVNDPNWIIDPVFDDEAWANQIGPSYWSFPGGSSITTPTQDAYNALKLTANRAQITALITAERYRRTSTGGYLVNGKWFNSDDSSRIQQIGLMIMGANIPAGIMWKTMDGTFVLMTQTLAVQIFQAAAASDMNFFAICQSKIATMAALPDPTTYDYLSGWPKIYGE